MNKPLLVEVRRSKIALPYYVIKSPYNGQILATSQLYFSKTNAFRAAWNLVETIRTRGIVLVPELKKVA